MAEYNVCLDFLDKDKQLVGSLRNGACFAGLGSWRNGHSHYFHETWRDRPRNPVRFIRYKLPRKLITKGDKLYYSWMSKVWFMPKMAPSFKEFNDIGMTLDIERDSFLEMFIALNLARMPYEFEREFTNLFLQRHEGMPSIPLTHIFVLCHSFPGPAKAGDGHCLLSNRRYKLEGVTDDTFIQPLKNYLQSGPYKNSKPDEWISSIWGRTLPRIDNLLPRFTLWLKKEYLSYIYPETHKELNYDEKEPTLDLGPR